MDPIGSGSEETSSAISAALLKDMEKLIDVSVQKFVAPLYYEQTSFKKSTDEKLDLLMSKFEDIMSTLVVIQKTSGELPGSATVKEEVDNKSSPLKTSSELPVHSPSGFHKPPPLVLGDPNVSPTADTESESVPDLIPSQLSSSSVRDDIDRTGSREVPKPKKPPDGVFTQSVAGSNKLDDWTTSTIDLIRTSVDYRNFLKPILQLWQFICGLNPNLYKNKRFKRLLDFIVIHSASLFSNIISVLPDINQEAITIHMKTNGEYKFDHLFSQIPELSGSVDLSFYKTDYCYVFGLLVYLRQLAGVDVQLRADSSLAKFTNFRFYPSGKFAEQITHFQTILNRAILDSEETDKPLVMSDNDKKIKLIRSMEYHKERVGFGNILLTFTNSVVHEKTDKSSFLTFCDLIKRTLGSTPDSSKAATSSKKSSDEKSATPSNYAGAVNSQVNNQNKQQGQQGQNSNQSGSNNNNKKNWKGKNWKGKKNNGNNQNNNNSGGQGQAQSNQSAANQADRKDNSSSAPKGNSPPNVPVGQQFHTLLVLDEAANTLSASPSDTVVQSFGLTRDCLILDSGSAFNVGCGPNVMVKESIHRIPPMNLMSFNGKSTSCQHYGQMKITDRVTVDNTIICPQARTNLLSVSAITQSLKYLIVFSQSKALVIPISSLSKSALAEIFNKDNSALVFEKKNRLYQIKLETHQETLPPQSIERHSHKVGDTAPYYPEMKEKENLSSHERRVQRAHEEERKAAKDSVAPQNNPPADLRIPKLPQAGQGKTTIVPRVPPAQASSSSSNSSSSVSQVSSESDTQSSQFADPNLYGPLDVEEDYPFQADYVYPVNLITSASSSSPSFFESSSLVVSSSSSSAVVETRDVGVQADRRLESQTWHARLAHVGFRAMSNINQYFAMGISKKALMDMCSDCSVCLIAKQRKVNITDPVRRSRLTPAVESSAVSDSPPPLLVLDEVSADLMGPMSFFDGEQLKLPSISGNNYVLVLRFFNRASGMKFIMVRNLKTKEASEVVPLFISLIEYMEKQTNCHLLNFHSDGGGEFVNNSSKAYFAKRGIRQTITPPGTPALNPTERENLSLIILVKCMLTESGASPYLWDLCVAYAAYILERVPLLVNSQLVTPLEFFFKAKPSTRLIHTFGSNCYVIDVQPSNRTGKFQASGFSAVFVGVDSQMSCPLTLCSDANSTRYLSLCSLRDVKIEEGMFSIAESIRSACQQRAELIAGEAPDREYEVEKILDFDEQKNSFLIKWKHYALTTWEPRSNLKNCAALLKDFLASYHKKNTRVPRVIHPSSSSLFVSSAPVNHINSSIGIEGISLFYANSHLVASATADITDEYGDLTPGSYNSAKRSSEWPQWEKAVDEELTGLDKLGTFNEESVPPRTHVLGTRWVFKRKRDMNHVTVRHKARLVVKGFQQIFGSEYNETYSPTPKMKCIKILLSLAAVHDWEIFQLDFENAFVHADLEELVYIHIPQGYTLKDSSLVNPALRLVKSLYGLKQAPRSWYLALHTFLEQHQFKRITTDHCVWSRSYSSTNQSYSCIILCIYVDDTLAFVPSPLISVWIEFKTLLATHFRIKDLGDSKWILNMEIIRDRINGTVSMDQQAYVSTVVARFPVESSRQPPSTPYFKDDITIVPDGTDSTSLSPSNHSKYRSIVGCLLYAANISRIDISHIVNVLCRYMHAPLHFHLEAAEFVLRYLAPRTSFPLLLGRKSALSSIVQSENTSPVLGLELVLWSDADFANERGGILGEKRHSVSGLLVTINNHAAWWTSTKQSQLAQSSTESELYALNGAARESMFLHYFLRDLLEVNFVPVIMADNDGSALISDHNTSHTRTKHIDIRDLYIRELMENKKIFVQLISSAQQLADLLTKSFPGYKRARYYQLLSLLGFSPSVAHPP